MHVLNTKHYYLSKVCLLGFNQNKRKYFAIVRSSEAVGFDSTSFFFHVVPSALCKSHQDKPNKKLFQNSVVGLSIVNIVVIDSF